MENIKKLIKVEYKNEKGKLIAIENYTDGSKRKVKIKNGIVNYILEGERKLTPKDKNIKLEFSKSELENKKELYDNILEAIATYCDSLGIRAIRSEDMKSKVLLQFMDKVRDKPKEFHSYMFGEPTDKIPSELDKIKYEIEHLDKLIKWGEYILKDLNLNIRKKMAKDVVENMFTWNHTFDLIYELDKTKRKN